MANVIGWSLLDGNRLARTVGRELVNPNSYSNVEFIQAAQKALKKHPREWIIYYSLADKYQSEGYYAEALKAAHKCVELKPKDIRSSYALASSYYILTRVDWSERAVELSDILRETFHGVDKLDKRYAQAGLDHTGIDVEVAAVQSIRWFEKCLILKPDIDSKNLINSHLQTLYRAYPNLGM